jgi:hypothetical protein
MVCRPDPIRTPIEAKGVSDTSFSVTDEPTEKMLSDRTNARDSAALFEFGSELQRASNGAIAPTRTSRRPIALRSLGASRQNDLIGIRKKFPVVGAPGFIAQKLPESQLVTATAGI